MTTTSYEAGPTWTEVTQVATDKDFILQNLGGASVLAHFGTVTPALGEAAIVVESGGSLIRAGVEGKLYIMSGDAGKKPKLTVS